MKKNEKILVTGGCGYIGSHTVVDLLHAGYEPILVDNMSNADPKVLDQIQAIAGRKVTLHRVDLRDRDGLEQVFEKEKNILGIIHFAALKMVGESVEQPLRYYDNNVTGQINLLGCQQKYGVQHHIFSSSCSVYGITDQLPVTEDAPLQEAESPYARTKQINENIIRDFSVAHPEYKFCLLRYFNPAGAHHSGSMGESPINPPQNLVPIITETAAGKRASLTVYGIDYDTRDGSCIRDYIHIEDLARAHTLALQSLLAADQPQSVEVYNLGCGEGVSVLEAISAFETVSGQSLNYVRGDRRPGDVISIYADYSKAKNKLGWTPRYSIQDIMKTAWSWQQKLVEMS